MFPYAERFGPHLFDVFLRRLRVLFEEQRMALQQIYSIAAARNWKFYKPCLWKLLDWR
jgi:hypothetical protein